MDTTTNVNEEQGQLGPSWDNLPTDILLLMFQYLPTASLPVCMFVSQTWRNHVEHILEVKDKWKELEEMNFSSFSEFKIKCTKSFEWRQTYYNYILWHSFHKATLNLRHRRPVNGIKKIHIYRDHLIIVTHENVQYYDAKTLNLQSTVEWLPCEDFHENDFMVVKVFKQGKCLKLHLLLKLESIPIYMTQSDVLTVDNVICYRIHNDECHVLDHRNVLSLFTIVDRKWRKKFLGRYYGNADNSCSINVYDNQLYLMLKGGFIFWMDHYNGHFKIMTQITVWKKSQINDQIMQRICDNSEVIYRKMFLWCVIHNIKECSQIIDSSKKSLCKELYTQCSNPMDESIIFPYKVRDVSCTFLHGDILFLGYLDGTIDLISARDLTKDFCETKPLRRFNIKYFKDTADLAVLSIDVYEEESIQHMYVATNTHILHLHITHMNCEDYMWSEEACKNML